MQRGIIVISRSNSPRMNGVVRQRLALGNAFSTTVFSNTRVRPASSSSIVQASSSWTPLASGITKGIPSTNKNQVRTTATYLYSCYSLGYNISNHMSVVQQRKLVASSLTFQNYSYSAIFNLNSHKNFYSTTTIHNNSKYVVIDHSQAYELAMNGRHGQQLELAKLEGIGKDDPPFDPFLEEELLMRASQTSAVLDETNPNVNNKDDGTEIDEVDEGYEADISDGEIDQEFEGDDDDDDDEEYYLNQYNPDGSLKRKKSVLATLRAGYPSCGLFAIIELAGSQYKITTDDLLVVNKLKPIDSYKIGSVHTFKDVLLVGSTHLTMVGLPYVSGAEVDVMVEEITQDAKVIIFKKRRRKHSQRKNGYRRDLTLLRVLDIRLPEEYKDHNYIGRDSVDKLHDKSYTQHRKKDLEKVTSWKQDTTKRLSKKEEVSTSIDEIPSTQEKIRAAN